MGITTSEQTNELAAALAAARGEFQPIGKDHTADTGKYKYDYADLADVLEAVTPALSKHGLFLWQDSWTVGDPDGVTVYVQTRIDHASGQWIQSSPLGLPIASDSKLVGSQAIGSVITYGSRYQCLSILGVRPSGEDDDGNKGSGTGASTVRKDREPLPICPNCSVAISVIADKYNPGGFFCFPAKGGCGAKWHPTVAQQAGTKPPTDAPGGTKQAALPLGTAAPSQGTAAAVVANAQAAAASQPAFREQLAATYRKMGVNTKAKADHLTQFILADKSLLFDNLTQDQAETIIDQLAISDIPPAEMLKIAAEHAASGANDLFGGGAASA